jgi:molybdopterin-guanine dinucleotide biosynthesis protein B
MKLPAPLHIVGRSGHGKTMLIEALVAELAARGLRVGSVKHSGHAHDLDAPGKDSYRHRAAGASPAAIVTPALVGAFLRRAPEEDVYARLAPLYTGCDLTLIEGDLAGAHAAPRVEVWRAAPATPPLALADARIAAVVSDDLPPALRVPVWPRADVGTLADRVLALARR